MGIPKIEEEKYLAIEKVAEERHEYRGGRIIAMTGDTSNGNKSNHNSAHLADFLKITITKIEKVNHCSFVKRILSNFIVGKNLTITF